MKKKKKQVHGSVSMRVPRAWHYPNTTLSFGPLPFFRILVSSWMVNGTWTGRGGGVVVGGVGVRGLAGDELTGYYWLCQGLVHKSPLSLMARTARTPPYQIKVSERPKYHGALHHEKEKNVFFNLS